MKKQMGILHDSGGSRGGSGVSMEHSPFARPACRTMKLPLWLTFTCLSNNFESRKGVVYLKVGMGANIFVRNAVTEPYFTNARSTTALPQSLASLHVKNCDLLIVPLSKLIHGCGRVHGLSFTLLGKEAEASLPAYSQPISIILVEKLNSWLLQFYTLREGGRSISACLFTANFNNIGRKTQFLASPVYNSPLMLWKLVLLDIMYVISFTRFPLYFFIYSCNIERFGSASLGWGQGYPNLESNYPWMPVQIDVVTYPS